MDEQELEQVHRDAEAYALSISEYGPWVEPDPRRLMPSVAKVLAVLSYEMGKAARHG